VETRTNGAARATWVPARIQVKIDHFSARLKTHYAFMKITEKQALSARCPTCGAKPGEKCELSTGQPRTEPHRDRRLAASEN
jgi:hypothetical protein